MREFSIGTTGATTVAGSTVLVHVRPTAAPNANLEFLRWWVDFSGTATSAQQAISMGHQGSTFPTLTAATPAKLKLADPNVSIIVGSTNGAAGTAGINSSNDNGGTHTSLVSAAFNALNGWLHVPTPDEIVIGPAGFTSGVALKFPTTPSVLTTWHFGTIIRER